MAGGYLSGDQRIDGRKYAGDGAGKFRCKSGRGDGDFCDACGWISAYEGSGLLRDP